MKKLVQYIPNGITLARIGLTIIFITIITKHFVYEINNLNKLVVVFLAICLSDIIDGRIARKNQCTSETGAKLDVIADLFFIVMSNITLIGLKILPPWFLGFILLKFIEFIITSKLTRRDSYVTSKNVFVFDKIGRIVSAMFFVVPGAACVFQILTPEIAKNLINTIIYMVLSGGILSSYLRIINCFKSTIPN